MSHASNLSRNVAKTTFLATRNATIAVAKWGVTREFFRATCNATFVAMRVARKIASCNVALSKDDGYGNENGSPKYNLALSQVFRDYSVLFAL